MIDPKIDVPDDLLQKVLALCCSYLEFTLNRDPSEAELVTTFTSVMIRVGMMTDTIAQDNGVDHPFVIRTALAAAEKWRARKEHEHVDRSVS